jgi:adenosine deaminase
VQYADHGVVGFGLSNDERRGTTAEFAPAFGIAERGGLALMPHGGELVGPESVRTCLDALHADRLGHGIRSVEDPALLERIVEQGIALEVCPVSNVALGVYSDLTSVPLPQLLEAGATVALGADDPLLFGSRLAGQYATMRAAHDLTDEQLAELARMSVRASRAPSDVVKDVLHDIDGWLAADI